MDIERPTPNDARPYGRRTFLTLVAGGASSLLWGPAAWNIARDVLLPVAGVLPPPLGGLVRSGWRIYSVTSIPHFDPATWSLEIDGLVERPVELSYADLRALPRAEQATATRASSG